MKRAAILLLTAALIFPVQSIACLSNENPIRQNIRYYPIVGDTTDHWPAETTTAIGSITSFLVPIDAKVELKHIKQGMMAPLTIFGEPSHEQMRQSPDLVPKWVDLRYDLKKFRWVHIYASSFGESEIHMSTPKGWSKTMKLTMVYQPQTERASRRPVELTVGAGDVPSATVDGRDNIEVIAPGSVADGWSASPASETGFHLVRIEQVSKTDGEPQVKLFFAGTRNPKSSTMVLRHGNGASATTLEFRINARPTPAC